MCEKLVHNNNINKKCEVEVDNFKWKIDNLNSLKVSSNNLIDEIKKEFPKLSEKSQEMIAKFFISKWYIVNFWKNKNHNSILKINSTISWETSDFPFLEEVFWKHLNIPTKMFIVSGKTNYRWETRSFIENKTVIGSYIVLSHTNIKETHNYKKTLGLKNTIDQDLDWVIIDELTHYYYTNKSEKISKSDTQFLSEWMHILSDETEIFMHLSQKYWNNKIIPAYKKSYDFTDALVRDIVLKKKYNIKSLIDIVKILTASDITSIKKAWKEECIKISKNEWLYKKSK